MKLVVALEHRFVRVGDRFYSTVFTYEHAWSRYLSVFDEVHVLARVERRSIVPRDRLLANAPGVSFIDVPNYRGPREYLRRRSGVRASVDVAAATGDAFILRLPGMIGTSLWRQVVRSGKPYGVEVVGDPWDLFASSASDAALRPFYRRYFSGVLRRQCRQAQVAAYVTRAHLQRRYPCPNWTTHYSSVLLPAEAYLSNEDLLSKLSQRRLDRSEGVPWEVVHIGTMAQPYKRQDLLIDAIARLIGRGLGIRLTLVGDGEYRKGYERFTHELGISDNVRFVGQVPAGEAVARLLDESDLFVLSSETEGLARVLMEAGARGLPIVATDTGGTSEFVEAEELVEPSSSTALADKIAEVLANNTRILRLSSENLERSRLYEKSVLALRSKELCLRLSHAAEFPARGAHGDET